MRGSVKLFTVAGISINIHFTFFLILILALPYGIKWVFVICGIFFFVVMHELCHSLVAKRFGVIVREITLFPIGGVASMTKMPEKPLHELLISIAGPLSNIAVVAVFYYPLKYMLGSDALFYPLTFGTPTITWATTVAYVYWLNLMLAGFNLLPAFPMDGGRILRSILAARVGYQKATRIAVNFGHIFALVFAYFGIVKFNIILIIIAVFIYMAASNEEMSVDLKETLKKFRVRDILPHDFYTLSGEATLAKVLEFIFHSHQEDFPVVEDSKMAGFITRQDIMYGIHHFGMNKTVKEIMRVDFPRLKDTDSLIKAQDLMQESGMRALPVVTKEGMASGVVTLEDIGRIYSVASSKA